MATDDPTGLPERRGTWRTSAWSRRLRFLGPWAAALALLGVVLPRTLDVSWHGVVPVLRAVHWPGILALSAVWLVGLVVHSFVLTAAAPSLTHRRALTLNMTGSAIANVVPLGGAAGVELNRRMMKAWGIDTRGFTGFTFLTNVWDTGSKLLLPIVGVVVLTRAGETVTPALRDMSLVAAAGFLALAPTAVVVLRSPCATRRVGRAVERILRQGLRMFGRDRPLNVATALDDIRAQSADLVARGWLRMSLGIAGYVALQGVLLGLCLQLTGAGLTWPEVLAGFAVERLLTVVPVTPGGVGTADIGLVGTLLALGGDPTRVAAAAVLYRLFVFAVEIPVGGGVLGMWLVGQRRHHPPQDARPLSPPRMVAHVTDVFLPRLGGIETHVDDLVRHQRAVGVDAHVLTGTRGTSRDPAWVHRTTAAEARRDVAGYDAVHVHVSLWSPYAVAVARAAIAAGIPTLVTVHSMWTGAGVLLRLAALASLRRWPVAWSAVSAPAAESLRRSLVDVDVAVLCNAVDVADWTPGPTLSPPSAVPTTDRRPVTLVSVMRLMPRKRPFALLRMFVQLRRLVPQQDLRLVIVGEGPLRPKVERYVARHGLSDAVRVTGRIPREQVIGELRSADVYVAPAPKESFGIAALEARCAGLPVVARRSSGVTEFIRDRIDGLLVDDDTQMVVALAELTNNSDLRARITAHNARVRPSHDWSDALNRTDVLYRRAVERTGRVVPRAAPVADPVAAGA
jgi:glycosyltransferase involved in cell wall biosynthesis/uncharacterized membrane protein YbhN (UPF0104 family)